MGRATATPNPAPRRSRVEQEILRCAAIGEAADFTGPQWKRVKRVDGRVVVSGKFLADLWLGTAGVRVHPTGLSFKGLHVDGMIWVGYARLDAFLRSPLASFHATDCTLTGGLGLAFGRFETISLTNCQLFEQPTDGRSGVGEADAASASSSEFSALLGIGAEIIGTLRLNNCRIDGSIDLHNSVIDDEVLITQSQISSQLSLPGSEMRAGIKILSCSFTGRADHAIMAMGAVVGGETVIAECRLRGGIHLGLARTHAIQINLCQIGQAGLILSDTAVDGRLMLFRTRVRGPISQYGGSARAVRLARSVVAGSIDLTHCSIAGDFLFERSRVQQGLFARAINLDGKLVIGECRISAPQTSETAIDLTTGTIGDIDIWGSTVRGIVLLDDLRTGRFGCATVAIECCPVVEQSNPSSHRVCVRAARAKFTSDVALFRLAVSGEINLVEIDVGGNLSLNQCWVGNEATVWSLDTSRAKVNSNVQLENCVLTGAVAMPSMQMEDLYFHECRLARSEGRKDGTRIGAWLANMKVGRCIALTAEATDEAKGLVVAGALDLTDTRVGSYIAAERLIISADDPENDGKPASALILKNVRVGSTVNIGHIANNGLQPGRPHCELRGAMVLDGLEAGEIKLGDRLEISAIGVAATSKQRDHLRVAQFKHGVAVSARNTAIGQRTVIAARRLHGQIDLRDSTLGSLVDKGGRAWVDAGVEPGLVLLEGTTFTGLDDDQLVAGEVTPGSTAHPHGAVARRLDWLAMQYPGGEPDASSFTPQPYEQLARHYASMGDERARRQVLVRKRQLQRTHSGLGWIERTVSGLLGLTSDYGYSPGKASIASALVITFGALAAWGLHSAGAIAPAGDEAGRALFSPLLFALDVAVPFLDLGHDSLWRIDPTALPAWPGRTLTMGLAEALYRLAGLVMLSITVLTFSGILHEKE